MCGIVGYVGSKGIGTRLIEGLKRLEYRGYDSSGLSVIENKQLQHTKRVGRVKTLEAALPQNYLKAQTGICHTRWATHGDVTEKNAHPHISSDQCFALVHNGVIENYLQIKQFLESKNYTFASDTDSEAIVNLIAYHFKKEPEEVVERRKNARNQVFPLLDGGTGPARSPLTSRDRWPRS